MFFRSWSDIWHVVLASTITFAVIVALLRVVGQQALARMSGYDIVVTVTLGSIIAAVTLSRDVTVSEAIAGLVTLIILQELTRWLQSRWLLLHHAVRQAPHVVLWNGTLLEDRLRETSTSGDEVRAAVRRAGISSLSEVLIVVLENDGEWSVVRKSDVPSDDSAFFGLPIPGRVHRQDQNVADKPIAASPYRVP